jgi:hypothetical protein
MSMHFKLWPQANQEKLFSIGNRFLEERSIYGTVYFYNESGE